MERKTNWFVEPLDSPTNEALARLLASTGDVMEAVQLKVFKGGHCSAFQLPGYQIITKLKNGKTSFGFKFRAYYQQNPHGPLYEWKFA